MERKQKLEKTLSAMTGQPVEITVRNDRSFTFSTETVCDDLPSKIKAFFGDLMKGFRVYHDEETGTFVYVDV